MCAKIAVIGGGFAGLSAASYLKKMGHQVTIFEKNEQIGGRARKFEQQGFVFDMGPSWYWMPDVFENYFKDFGYKVSDFFELVQLDPGFDVVFSKQDCFSVDADFEKVKNKFEQLENGSGVQLGKFIDEADRKYQVSMNDIVFKPSYSLFEYINWKIIKNVLAVDFFIPLRRSLKKYFTHPNILKIMEFPVLFLGAMADKIPALYSIMNYAALKQGTFYPLGGMHKIVEAMEKVAVKLGVEIQLHAEVQKIIVEGGKAKGIVVNQNTIAFDGVVAAADYEFVERKLLERSYQNYNSEYWDKKVFAPSSLLFYIGVSKKIDKLNHHTLFFDTDFELHSKEIYHNPKWPTEPLFYTCTPSVTDASVAPENCENLFLLIPIATGLEDNEALREKYFDKVMARLEDYCEMDIRSHIIYKRSYCKNDFILDYNSFKGNAYGLANTLLQTGPLKPTLKNKKVSNLYYCGQLTVPGPGVPPSLISGKIVAAEISKNLPL
jgi:phytoene desaturase